MMREQWNAFIREDISMEPSKTGVLQGLTFAAKDVFAVKGHTNAAGNPDWLRTHEASEGTASAIEVLLAEGAGLYGLTHTDELMYSLNGENVHYGTPVNPKVSSRIPGGSSSGSAVAVAAGLRDFALGTDTGGSVRIPAAYCGIYGFRPSHGAISAEGVIPLARSFDTVGLLARSSEILKRAGQVLLPRAGVSPNAPFKRVWFAEDAWKLVAPEVRSALAPAGPILRGLLPHFKRITLSEAGLPNWAKTFRIIQGYEIWREHGAWISQEQPRFGPDIAARFASAAAITEDEYEKCREQRQEIVLNLQDLLQEDGVLAIPTAPKAPSRGLLPGHMQRTRAIAMGLCCIAGLSGFPQITIPFAEPGGVPVGLSLIAGRGQDAALLNWVHENLSPVLAGAEHIQ